jgi:polyisoprenoid-binding protein YceI
LSWKRRGTGDRCAPSVNPASSRRNRDVDRSEPDQDRIRRRRRRLAAHQRPFHAFSGKIAVDLRRPEASNVSFRVGAKSIEVGSPSFDDYLRGDAFFDVAQYPEITFVSTAVEKVANNHARVSGDLTLRGVTHPFTIDVEIERSSAPNEDRLDFRATGIVHRLEFGMNAGFPAIGNDVDLIISTQVPAEPQ